MPRILKIRESAASPARSGTSQPRDRCTCARAALAARRRRWPLRAASQPRDRCPTSGHRPSRLGAGNHGQGQQGRCRAPRGHPATQARHTAGCDRQSRARQDGELGHEADAESPQQGQCKQGARTRRGISGRALRRKIDAAAAATRPPAKKKKGPSSGQRAVRYSCRGRSHGMRK